MCSKDEFKRYLTDHVLAFWLKNGIDDKYDGILTCLDQTGKLYSEEKSVWFQGRALWVFSKAYNIIEKKQEYIDAARKIYNFLPKCIDDDGRMFFIVTRDGKEIQKRRYFFSETFAAIGCAEYYKATRDEGVWKMAKRCFKTALDVFSNPKLLTPKFNTDNRPLKPLSPIMIMLATAEAMESVGKEREYYGGIAQTLTREIIYGGFINEDVGALLEYIKTDGSFSDTPTGRTVNPGHSLEAAWFLLSEGVLRNDCEAQAAAKKIIDMTMPIGWDNSNGGIIAFMDVLGKPEVALEWDMKLWWPQCEAIIASKLAWILFGDIKYKENYEKILEYAFEHFEDREYGEWYGYLHYDNTPSNKLKGNIFKGPFHLPRMLMLLSVCDSKEGFLSYLK